MSLRPQTRWAAAAATALAFAAGLAYWAQRGAATPQPAGRLRVVSIAINSAYAGACPVLAAQRHGHFAAEGLDVRLLQHPSGRAALQQALSGGADFATVADLPVAIAAAEGRPVVILANMFKAERDNGIVARRDRGVQAPADLRGRRIGVTAGTSPHFMLDAFLNRAGLSVRDVVVVNLAPAALADALLGGSIDAAATWQPILDSIADRAGNNAAVFFGDRVYNAVFLLAAHRDTVGSRGDDVRALLRAVLRGAVTCADAAAGVALLELPQDTDRAALHRKWEGYKFSVALEQSLLLALEDEAAWAISQRLASGAAPNFLDHIETGPLRAVRPAAVSLIE